jgi:hypothetical protein
MRPSIRFYAVVLVAVLAAGGCNGGKDSNAKDTTTTTLSATSSTAPAQTCGDHEIDGVNTRTFCGAASSTLSVGGAKTSFTGGACETTPEYVSVSVGTVVLGTGAGARGVKNTTVYFKLDAGRTPADGKDIPAATKDGVYKGSFIANDHGLATTAPSAQVTLTDNRTKGQFSGKTLDGTDATGTFSCT